MRERQTEKERFHPLLHWLNVHSSWGWPSAKPEAKNTWSPCGCQGPSTGAITTASQAAHEQGAGLGTSTPVQDAGLPGLTSTLAPALSLLPHAVEKLQTGRTRRKQPLLPCSGQNQCYYWCTYFHELRSGPYVQCLITTSQLSILKMFKPRKQHCTPPQPLGSL